MYLKQLSIGVFLTVAAMAAPVWADAAGAPHCSNATLTGKYAFLARGTTFAASGLPAPLTGVFASKGTAEYDGRGHVTLTAISSFNGIVQGPLTAPGTYQVNSDCSFTSQLANGATFRGAIVGGGSELFILQTNAGVANAGVAKAVNGGAGDDDADFRNHGCSAASLTGTYGFLAEGAAGAPTLPGTAFGPLAGVGIVTLNPNGSFQMMAQRSVAGVIDAQVLPLMGTFTVNPDCSYRLNFDVGFHFDATAVSRDESLFIETDPGTAVTVRSRRL